MVMEPSSDIEHGIDGREGRLDRLRQDVALTNRVVHAAGLVNAFGHVSARIPGTETFLFPTRASPGLAKADRLLTLDTGGRQLGGEGMPNTEFWIHARIYAARPDVLAVAHVHAESCVVLGQMGQTVRLMHNQGAFFRAGVPVHHEAGLIRSRAQGDRVAATLGDKRAMLLRGHGANVVDGVSVRNAAVLACMLEEAARIQLAALQAAGGDASRITFYSDEETEVLGEQLDNAGPLDRAWEYYAALAEGRVRA